jgi:RND family efflux transporter MFP subunit
MKKTILLMMLSVILFGCGDRSSGSATRGRERLTPVMVREVEHQSIYDQVEVIGRVEGIVDITMSSDVSGTIEAVYKRIGDWVEQGEEIGKIENSDLVMQLRQAEASKKSAEAAFESAQLSMNSADKLRESNSISQAEYQRTLSSLKGAESSFEAAKANHERALRAYKNSRFVSPVAGYIANLPIKVGENISPGRTIASIIDSRQLILRTGVGESQIGKIRRDQRVEVNSRSGNKDLDGIIHGFGIKPTPGSLNYPIEILIDNPDNALLPGMVVSAKIFVQSFDDVISISPNHYIKQFDRNYVFIVDDENVARKREINLSRMIGDIVLVEQGLEAGDRLVTDGIENLEDGMKVEVRR